MDDRFSDGDDDTAEFRAVEEEQTIKWSGFNECDARRRIARARAPISGGKTRK